MSCTPIPKAAKLVWAKQLTRLPCLGVYGEFQFVYKPLVTPFHLVFNTGEVSGVRVDESKMLITARCRHSRRFNYESEAREILLVCVADDSQ